MAANLAVVTPDSNPQREIEVRLDALAQRARSDQSPADFTSELLQCAIATTHARMAQLCLMNGSAEVSCAGRLSASPTEAVVEASPELSQAEREFVSRCIAQQKAQWALPNSEPTLAGVASNPTTDAWVCAPLPSGPAMAGGVLIALAWTGDLAGVRRSASVLSAIVEIAATFFERQRLTQTVDEIQAWRNWRAFCAELHRDPSPERTASAVAQETQRLTGADRVWLLVRKGRRLRAAACSGVAAFHRRADVVQALERLASLTCRTGDPLHWQTGCDERLAPQLQHALDAYLDESHVRSVRLQPLLRPQPPGGKTQRDPDVIAAVVCEWFRPNRAELSSAVWDAVCEQSEMALQNAADWGRAPLSLLLRNSRRRSVPWTWLRNSVIAAAAAGGVTAAAFYPIDLTIEGRGELQPAVRQHVFANADGIIDRLHVATGDFVKAGQVLAELRSPELDIEYQRVRGDLETAQQRLAALEASRLDARLRGNDDLARMRELTSQLEETRQTISSLENQLVILGQRRNDLKVISPLDGEVLTWDVERQLGHRPVMRGQRLLTVAARSGAWQLELRVDDDYAGDLHRNFRPGGPPVRVDYVLATAPDQSHTARLGKISATAEVRTAGEGPTLLCTVPVASDAGQTSAGLGARARIYCGQYPLGYVWFRDLWRVFRTNVLFPLGW